MKLRLWSAVIGIAVIAPIGNSANSAERVVLLEKLSATWCPHCMAAAHELDELTNDFGEFFIPLEIFSTTSFGGRYSTPWGQWRTFDFYDLASYPTAWFDGAIQYTGSTNVYATYLSGIAYRLGISTDVAIDIRAQQTGDGSYDVTASISLEAGGAAKTVRITMVEALDYYGHYDDNATIPRNVLRHVIEDGFDVDLVPGQTQHVTRSFTLDQESRDRFSNVRLIGWAQAPALEGPAEVYNAAQLSLAETMSADFDGNGVVSGADLGLWRGAYGIRDSADANGDGRSDGADFLAWQRTLGNTRPVGKSDVSLAPEPTSGLLASLFASCLDLRRRSARRVRRHDSR